MPLEQLEHIATEMKLASYRPVNVRPFLTHAGLRFSAVWKRDSSEWILDTSLTRPRLDAQEVTRRKEGLLPDDVSCYFVDQDVDQPRFIVVWRRFPNADIQRSIYAGRVTEFHRQEQERHQNARFYERSRHLTTTPDGLKLQHSMVWAIDEDNREDGFFYHCSEDEFFIIDRTQPLPTDLCVTKAMSDDESHVYAHYSGLWVNRTDLFEAEAVLANDLPNHIAESINLVEQGYRPSFDFRSGHRSRRLATHFRLASTLYVATREVSHRSSTSKLCSCFVPFG